MKKNILVYGAGLMGRGIAQVFRERRNMRSFYMILKTIISWEK